MTEKTHNPKVKTQVHNYKMAHVVDIFTCHPGQAIVPSYLIKQEYKCCCKGVL